MASLASGEGSRHLGPRTCSRLNDGVDQRHTCPVRLFTQKRPLPTRPMNTAVKW